MGQQDEDMPSMRSSDGSATRSVRSDAKRNTDALLEAAMEVFATRGVDAPVREIAQKAGVGIGTVYRHFPQRADLIAAVFRREVDACADAAAALSASYGPADALAAWLLRYTDFIAAKRGLAPALHSGDPAYVSLHSYFKEKLLPVLRGLLDAAIEAGEVRDDIESMELLSAVANLCISAGKADGAVARRMVSLVVDGLRYGATDKS